MVQIKNQFLTVNIKELGAELQSIKDSNGVEYLWQGDAKYWAGRATNLFPFVGRLTDGHYTMDGVKYPMNSHGFVRECEFFVGEHSEEKVELYIESNDYLRSIYPFEFRFSVIYSLNKNKLDMVYKVENTDNKTMYFAVGGHPGFNIPVANKGAFEDYFIEYREPCEPVKMGVSPACFMDESEEAYPLLNNTTMNLRHDLYDQDAVILKGMSKVLTIKNHVGAPEIEVGYPDMKYLATWHAVKMDAPYVCIEPWTTLPSRQDILEELKEFPDMNVLEAGQVYENKWWVTIS